MSLFFLLCIMAESGVVVLFKMSFQCILVAFLNSALV